MGKKQKAKKIKVQCQSSQMQINPMQIQSSKPNSNKKQKSKKHTAHRGSLRDHQAFFNPQTTAPYYNHKSPLTRGIVQIIENYDGLIPKDT